MVSIATAWGYSFAVLGVGPVVREGERYRYRESDTRRVALPDAAEEGRVVSMAAAGVTALLCLGRDPL